MADYSRLNNSMPVTSVADRIWEIQKKRRAEDRKLRNGKNQDKKKKEEDNSPLLPEAEIELVSEADDRDGAEDGGLSEHVAKTIHKVDVMI